jgi:hypothetical protein
MICYPQSSRATQHCLVAAHYTMCDTMLHTATCIPCPLFTGAHCCSKARRLWLFTVSIGPGVTNFTRACGICLVATQYIMYDAMLHAAHAITFLCSQVHTNLIHTQYGADMYDQVIC